MFKKRIKRVLAMILVFISAGIIFLERCKPKDAESPLPAASHAKAVMGEGHL